ncbi:MAG: shikimate dehydrogenase [Bacteroidetes bacterium]|jgi:shikimate dehydrogenase|uniref:shikimate dehydrogenase family protein n=1 Tax=Flavobacterium sp. TaxID=239 RepID=UPI002FD93C03|nr:shikimate dehydrogenase [Bacteroidota bacterium]
MSKRQFGLIGKNISYSFSKKYFTEKFALGNLEDYFYENFDLQSIDEFPEILKNNSDLKGLNVTIPFKETIIPYLDKLSKNAQKIGAVNVIRFTKKGSLKGYNSDYYGFIKSLKPLLKEHHKKALILGTGGASKGIAFGLEKLGILYTFVSREEKEGMINYNRINATTFDNFQIIINCTPLGTSPNVKEFPNLPYQFFTKKHIAFDLIYNPEETQFLKKAKKKGATIKNGFEMLQYQAEKSWKIWNK